MMTYLPQYQELSVMGALARTYSARQPAASCDWPHAYVYAIQAKNKISGRIIPILVLGFWDKNTGMRAGAMPYHQDFSATTRI